MRPTKKAAPEATNPQQEPLTQVFETKFGDFVGRCCAKGTALILPRHLARGVAFACDRCGQVLQ